MTNVPDDPRELVGFAIYWPATRFHPPKWEHIVNVTTGLDGVVLLVLAHIKEDEVDHRVMPDHVLDFLLASDMVTLGRP